MCCTNLVTGPMDGEVAEDWLSDGFHAGGGDKGNIHPSTKDVKENQNIGSSDWSLKIQS